MRAMVVSGRRRSARARRGRWWVLAVATAALLISRRADANQSDDFCQPGGPELVVSGTVRTVERPRPICEVGGAIASGTETCLAASFLQCAVRAAVVIEPPDGSRVEVALAPVDPPIDRAGSLRRCGLAPGTYRLILCPDDPEPLTCRVELRPGEVAGPIVRWAPVDLRVRLEVEAIEAGALGAERDAVTFIPAAGRAYRVGQRVRVELQRPRSVTDRGVEAGAWVEYRCYGGAPPRPRGSSGCAGCAGAPSAARGMLSLILLVVLGIHRPRRRQGLPT